MMPQEQKKRDKRHRLKNQMVAYYVLTAFVCHAYKTAIGFQENITALTVSGEIDFIVQ